MQFIIHATDRPDAGGLRQQVRPVHLEYLTALGAQILLAGPRLNAAGAPVGSTLIIEAADQAAAELIAASDPYARSGLFATVVVEPFRIVFNNPPGQA